MHAVHTPSTAPTGIVQEPRRATGKAIQYWDALRGERRYPRRDEVARDALPELEPHLFLVGRDDADRSCVLDGGAVLRDLCGADPIGHPVREALPAELCRRAGELIETAFQIGRPLADSGSFEDPAGGEVLYRAVFMPLSEDQRRVDGILGAISFKRRALH
jgi:hypothetical protein